MLKLTSRDIAILRMCAACQVLTTSQAHQLHFHRVTADAAQKRLRKLAGAQFLEAIETRTCTDNLYTLGKEGVNHVRSLGWKLEKSNTLPKDLAHHLGVTDIRIALERALAEIPDMHLRYFYAYWELGQFAWPYPIIPDAVLSLRNNRTIQAAIEFDRNTESIAVFAKKLLNYRTLVRLHPLSTVMLVAEERENLERLEEGLAEVFASIPLLILAIEDLKLHGLRAHAYPRPHLAGERTIAEQLEIDAAKLDGADTEEG